MQRNIYFFLGGGDIPVRDPKLFVHDSQREFCATYSTSGIHPGSGQCLFHGI